MTVFWAALMERQIMEQSVNALLSIAGHCALKGYVRIEVPYTTTDKARNGIAEMFMKLALHPDDKLIMLDCDQLHPQDVVERLAETKFDGVVGGLYWKRTHTPPIDEDTPPPLMFKGKSEYVTSWAPGELVTGLTAIGTGLICIPRWAFDQITADGCKFPWFRYHYEDDNHTMPGEDTYFCYALASAGVPMACNTAIISPHLYVWPWAFPPSTQAPLTEGEGRDNL